MRVYFLSCRRWQAPIILVITLLHCCISFSKSSTVPSSKNNPNSLLTNALKPGKVSVLRDLNQKIFSEHTYRIGLPLNLQSNLRQYCNDRGITALFRRLMTPEGSLDEGQEQIRKLGKNLNWSIHRPDKHWHSNMHWLSPADLTTHEDYLDALSKAGFDEVLECIGDKFDHIDGLVCFQLTFIAVSHCTEGFMHVDFDETQNRAFNVIIPLMLVDGSAPELSIQSDFKPHVVNELRYEENIGVMFGDMASHKTAACDYRVENKMRLAATVYLCDVNDENVSNILHAFTQQYPPKNGRHLLDQASDHWDRHGIKRLPIQV